MNNSPNGIKKGYAPFTRDFYRDLRCDKRKITGLSARMVLFLWKNAKISLRSVENFMFLWYTVRMKSLEVYYDE